jgi:5'-3' exonuclease
MPMAETKRNFILTDGNNLFHRQIRMTNPALGIDSMIGMSFHLILNSMRKEFSTWNGTHTVFFLEGRSWRKDYYPEYKANRKIAFAQQTEKEQEDFRILTDSFNEFVKYLDEKTNVTVLRNPKAEADDMIAVWIEAHPEDTHILISSDSDFFQLLRFGNVKIYDPVKDILIQRDGIFNDKGERLAFVVDTNAKIRVGKPDPNFSIDSDWYEYALFLKCIRGDSTDNIFSAYPGVREKGSTKKIGIMEAYADRTTQGYNWNNFMLQRWVDHEDNEHRVKDKYEFNKKLIDLKEIPEDVVTDCLNIIATETSRKNVPAVEIGMGFMKFCGKWDLKRIGNSAESYMSMLKSRYHE